MPTSLPLSCPTDRDDAATGPSTGRRRRRISAALIAGALGLGVLGACAPADPASRPRRASPRPRASSRQIDDEPTFCDPADSYDKPGPQALRTLLNATYGTIAAGITRTCDGSVSDHHEGRALDWMADYANPDKRAKALAVIDWLRATDAQGNTNAVARRLGLSYWIYNKQMYGSWNNFNPTPYSCAGDPTSCHVNHIHFSFTWAGAYKQISFWRGSRAADGPVGRVVLLRRLPRELARVLAPAQLACRSVPTSSRSSGTYRFGARPARPPTPTAATSAAPGPPPARRDVRRRRVLDLKIGGGYGVGGTTWTPVTNNGGGCNTADHRYRMTVRSWSALPITALVLDGRTDNSGALTVRSLPA